MPEEAVNLKKRGLKKVIITAVVSLLIGVIIGYAYKSKSCNDLIQRIEAKYIK